MHIQQTIADLFPDGFIWTPFSPDLDQATFEPRDTIPKLWQIYFQMASFGDRSVEIWIKPFPSPHTHKKTTIADFVPDGFIRTPFCPDLDQAISEPRYIFPKTHCRFASRLLHLDAVLPGSGSGHFRIRRRTPKTIADVAPDGFIWTPFCEDLDQAIFESGDTIPKQTCPACPALRPALPAYLPCLLADGRISGRAGQMCLLQTNVASDCFPRLMAIALPPNRIQLS